MSLPMGWSSPYGLTAIVILVLSLCLKLLTPPCHCIDSWDSCRKPRFPPSNSFKRMVSLFHLQLICPSITSKGFFCANGIEHIRIANPSHRSLEGKHWYLGQSLPGSSQLCWAEATFTEHKSKVCRQWALLEVGMGHLGEPSIEAIHVLLLGV